MCGQSSAYNTNATLLPTNPLFQGFSSYPNVNKEIILRKLIFQKAPKNRGFLYTKNAAYKTDGSPKEWYENSIVRETGMYNGQEI